MVDMILYRISKIGWLDAWFKLLVQDVYDLSKRRRTVPVSGNLDGLVIAVRSNHFCFC